jgi:hypothetical protein
LIIPRCCDAETTGLLEEAVNLLVVVETLAPLPEELVALGCGTGLPFVLASGLPE